MKESTSDRRSRWDKLKPYQGIIRFVVVLLLSNLVWKLTVKGDESDALVTFLGMDISAPFNLMALHFAETAGAVLRFFGSDVQQHLNTLSFDNGHGIRVVWACTGIKQAYIFLCIMAFSRGPWRKKLMYIPAGLLAVYLFNLLRITVITATTEHHFQWFDFLHEGLFKYLFYGVIFLLWLLWEEKIRLGIRKLNH